MVQRARLCEAPRSSASAPESHTGPTLGAPDAGPFAAKERAREHSALRAHNSAPGDIRGALGKRAARRYYSVRSGQRRRTSSSGKGRIPRATFRPLHSTVRTPSEQKWRRPPKWRLAGRHRRSGSRSTSRPSKVTTKGWRTARERIGPVSSQRGIAARRWIGARRRRRPNPCNSECRRARQLGQPNDRSVRPEPSGPAAGAAPASRHLAALRATRTARSLPSQSSACFAAAATPHRKAGRRWSTRRALRSPCPR